MGQTKGLNLENTNLIAPRFVLEKPDFQGCDVSFPFCQVYFQIKKACVLWGAARRFVQKGPQLCSSFQPFAFL